MTDATDWQSLTRRAGLAAHDLVGWLLWDPGAVARYEALGVPNGMGWVVSWRIAALGEANTAAIAAATYSIHPAIIDAVSDARRSVASVDDVMTVRNDSVVPGLDGIVPGLAASLGDLTDGLWRGVDSVHQGAKPMFAAHRAQDRHQDQPALSAWLAVNCLRELRGDVHWALCASEGLDDVEAGLLHSVMVDVEEYGSEEWIARSRGGDDVAVATGWRRLEAKGFADGAQVSDAGRAFRLELEQRTDELTTPAWQAVGEAATRHLCELVEPHHDTFVARIDATAGPRWMPAVRTRPASA